MKGPRGERAARCPGCRLVLPRCVCDAFPRLAPRTRVCIVMHRNERLKSSNTGRLAVGTLEGASLVVRGLAEVPAEPPLPAGRRLVLYPDNNAEELSAAHAAAGPVVLLVPDGTWAQARKLARRDALFRDVPTVRLPSPSPSRYLLRRNVREGTVCTFEAVARALDILEGGDIEARMLAILDAFQACALEVRARRGRLEPAPEAPALGDAQGGGAQPVPP